jgi:hypothetical protein
MGYLAINRLYRVTTARNGVRPRGEGQREGGVNVRKGRHSVT